MKENRSWRCGSVGRGLPSVSALCEHCIKPAWWGMCETPTLRKGRQGNQEFKAILGYVVRWRVVWVT